MMRWDVFVAGALAGALPSVSVLVLLAEPGTIGSGVMVAIAVAGYAAGLVTAAALRGPVVALMDWRTRLDRDRWRRWCDEEHAARREAERRLDELRALAGYRGRF